MSPLFSKSESSSTRSSPKLETCSDMGDSANKSWSAKPTKESLKLFKKYSKIQNFVQSSSSCSISPSNSLNPVTSSSPPASVSPQLRRSSSASRHKTMSPLPIPANTSVSTSPDNAVLSNSTDSSRSFASPPKSLSQAFKSFPISAIGSESFVQGSSDQSDSQSRSNSQNRTSSRNHPVSLPSHPPSVVAFNTNTFASNTPNRDTPASSVVSSSKFPSNDDRSVADVWATFYKFASTSRQTDSLIYANPRKEAYLQSPHTDRNPTSRQVIELWTMTALRFLLKGRLLFSPEKAGSSCDSVLDIQGLFRDQWSWQVALDNPASVIYGFYVSHSLLAKNQKSEKPKHDSLSNSSIRLNSQSPELSQATSKNSVNSTQDPSNTNHKKTDSLNFHVSHSENTGPPSSLDPPLSPKSMPVASFSDQIPTLPLSSAALAAPAPSGTLPGSSRRKSSVAYDSDHSISPRSSAMNINALQSVSEPASKAQVSKSPPPPGSKPGGPFGTLSLSLDNGSNFNSQPRRPSGQFNFDSSRRLSNIMISPMNLGGDSQPGRRESTTNEHGRRMSTTAAIPLNSSVALSACSNNNSNTFANNTNSNSNLLEIPADNSTAPHSIAFTNSDPFARRPSYARSTSSGVLPGSSSRRLSTSSFANSVHSSNNHFMHPGSGSGISSAAQSRRSSAVSVSSPLVNEITRASLSGPSTLTKQQQYQTRSRQNSVATNNSININNQSQDGPFPSYSGSPRASNATFLATDIKVSSSTPSITPVCTHSEQDSLYSKTPGPSATAINRVSKLFDENTRSSLSSVSSASQKDSLPEYPFQVTENDESSLKRLLFPLAQTEAAIPKGPANYIPCGGQSLVEMPFEDNTFDVISAKSLWCTIKKDDWVPVLKELYRVLKPGGYVELIVCDFEILNATPKDKYWWSLLRDSVEAQGMDPCPTANVPKHLYDAGYEEVTQSLITLPRGWGGQIGHLTEFLTLCYSEALFRIFSGLPPEAIDQFRMDTRLPLEDGQYPAKQLAFVYASKPNNKKQAENSELDKRDGLENIKPDVKDESANLKETIEDENSQAQDCSSNDPTVLFLDAETGLEPEIAKL